MLVVEAKLKNGTPEQYSRLDEAILTAQFIRNKCVRYWIDNKGTTRNDLQKHCSVLASDKTTPWANKLNSQARQSSADRAWASISRFYANCRNPSIKKKGFPKFKKHTRSVEYKVTGYKLSDDRRKITFTDGFKAGKFDLWCSNKTLVYYSEQQIKRVRVVKQADGYYCQFLIDYDREEKHEFTGSVVGIDLGLKEFYTDSYGNTVENPRYLRKSEKRLKKATRRLSKRFCKGKKKQSNNYHKQRKKVAKLHLKVSRQRKDKAIKDALALVQSHDLVVYEALLVSNMVKNHKLAKSISDASWYQFTIWVNYFAKIHRITCIAVPPHFTTIDCSVCGTKVEKTLSTRTHQCPSCETVLDRDHNAARNILSKGLKQLGAYLNGSGGHPQTDPNACQESGLWVFNRDVEHLSCLVETGIPDA
ncbi:RNA-guided endonuclease InsQ/TnpB family protein [Gloeothece verrucosa]|uniref:Putative transposase IS891/IS1136/IS1341 family n=1 Tax=Gloeothece verrucosa (strain PCC 7822) TaxID=497965 RepID=E0UAR6_GLOV7|nr:RNA-guided endonuclease TnpB family protein [Gloeothece verrucosa]ADN13918.1 putative transposase IS891/IS1136/IS1341 family [Gloeothece verrucosa PCC 7822]